MVGIHACLYTFACPCQTIKGEGTLIPTTVSCRSSLTPARRACAILNSVGSPRCFVSTWKPIGSPSSDRPAGTDTPGMPAMLAGRVSTSDKYIWSGSDVFSPSLNATVGEVAETMASNFSNSLSNSRLMMVRTC